MSSPELEGDRALAEAVLHRGDEAAFRRLYRRHTPRLLQMVLRLLGGPLNDAEDVVQEAWMQAIQKLATFRWESGFGTWLTAIGLNQARDLLRQRGRWNMEQLDNAPELRIAPPPGERLDLEQALALLPPGYRAILILHDLEGWTHPAIAARLGIQSGTSKSQLFRARRALRGLLQPVADDEESNHVREA